MLCSAVLSLQFTQAVLRTLLSTKGMLNRMPGRRDDHGKDEHKFLSKQHGESCKKLPCLPSFHSRVKRRGLPYSCVGVKRASSFSPLPQSTPGKDSGGRGLPFGSAYVLVTTLRGNSSAKLICCYQSTQWHKQVSADSSTSHTDGS